MFYVKIFILAMVIVAAGAFRPLHLHGRKSCVSRNVRMGNKLDGIEIEGDLSPMSNNLLVKVKPPLESTKGGLFIPDNAQERPTEGTVVSTGGGRFHSETGFKFEMQISPGDKVMYGEFDGSKMRYNDVDHQLIKDDDVLLVYSGDEAIEDSVRCIKDNLLVKIPPVEDTTYEGVIISTATEGQSSAKKPDRGTVVRVGPGRTLQNGEVIPMSVEPGDQIRFRDFAGTQIKLGSTEYIVIKDHDVMVKWRAA